MKPFTWLAIVVLILVEIYSLLPSRKSSFVIGDLDQPLYLTGAINVHSVYGEGSGTIEEIAQAASRSKLDFVVITDLDTSRARKEGLEKNYSNVDAFVEMEATTPAGHLLVFYSTTEARNWRDEQVVKAAWNQYTGKEIIPGVFTVVAHPSNIKNPWQRLDRFADGVEVNNFDSVWRRELDESLLSFSLTLALYPFNEFISGLRFNQIYPKDLTSWDAMNAFSKNHFGILGHDVRARLKFQDVPPLDWPSYEQAFRFASNVVYYDPPLSPDFEQRKRQIYNSLRSGKSAMVFQFIFPFQGNDWKLQCGDKSARSGATISLNSEKCQFLVRTPENFPFRKLLRLIRDGEVVNELETTDRLASFPVRNAGTYRLEVWAKPKSLLHILVKDPVPYVLYNPIYVK